jgi:hypothetical protein
MMSFAHSADYKYIDTALKSHWQPFTSLAREMDEFVPRPLTDYTAERTALFDEMRRANPKVSHERVVECVDQQIRYRGSPISQFAFQFEDRFISEYVTVALLAHALCEAAINAILALGLAQVGSQAKFAALERQNIRKKWLLGPQSYFPGWTLPQDGPLWQTLQQLTDDRNALTHHKITLAKIDGTLLMGGPTLQRKTYQEESSWVLRFFSLPYDLAQYALSTLGKSPPFFLNRGLTN